MKTLKEKDLLGKTIRNISHKEKYNITIIYLTDDTCYIINDYDGDILYNINDEDLIHRLDIHDLFKFNLCSEKYYNEYLKKEKEILRTKELKVKKQQQNRKKVDIKREKETLNKLIKKYPDTIIENLEAMIDALKK